MPRPADGWCSSLAVAAFVMVLVTCTCTAKPAAAQLSVSSPPVTLSQPGSVRSAGLNGSGGALVGNAGAVFANPAGIATIRHIGLEGAYRTLPSDGSIASGALAWRLRQFDLGLGVVRYRFGTDPSTHPILGIPGGVDAREYAGVGSLVYRFGIIAVAGSGKYVRRVVDDSPESAFGADAGLAIAIFDIMAFGLSVQNIGGPWGGHRGGISMPRLTRVAMTWNYVDPLETFRLLSTVELQWPDREDMRIVVGGEGGIVVSGVGLFARAAYGSVPTGSIYSRMTYGGSVTMSNLALDYAYQERDISGLAAHSFGFRLAL